jgi:metal-dependent amidase/aminoacylase/carboxypeptidase family protein
VTKTAEANGAIAEVTYGAHYPTTYNTPDLTEAMLPSLQKTAGASNIISGPALTVSEDFSFYAEKVPALFIFLGGMPKGADPLTVPVNHSPDFFIDESAFTLGTKAMCNLAVDYMSANSK